MSDKCSNNFDNCVENNSTNLRTDDTAEERPDWVLDAEESIELYLGDWPNECKLTWNDEFGDTVGTLTVNFYNRPQTLRIVQSQTDPDIAAINVYEDAVEDLDGESLWKYLFFAAVEDTK